MSRTSYSYAVETRIEDATRILTHYFGGSKNDNEDMRAEMRDVVTSIVDAAVNEAREQFTREFMRQPGIGAARVGGIP